MLPKSREKIIISDLLKSSNINSNLKLLEMIFIASLMDS